MPPPSLLLPRSRSYGDLGNDPHSSKEFRSPSIGEWDSFKVAIASPEPSPLPDTLSSELPTHNGPKKRTNKQPGYFWGVRYKYWIYAMFLTGVLSLASLVGGITAHYAAVARIDARRPSPATTEVVTMTMTPWHHHSHHHERASSTTLHPTPTATSTNES